MTNRINSYNNFSILNNQLGSGYGNQMNNGQAFRSSGFSYGPTGNFGSLFSGLASQVPSYYNPGYPAGGHQHTIPGGYGGSPAGGPLIIQGGGGKGGKKGRQNVQVVGGYGMGGGPLILQGGGGKGGKKGQTGVTIIGGYGQGIPQYPSYTGWAGEHYGHQFNGPSMPYPMPGGHHWGGGYGHHTPNDGGNYPHYPNNGGYGHDGGNGDNGNDDNGYGGKWW